MIALALPFDRPEPHAAIWIHKADKDPISAVSLELLEVILRDEVMPFVGQANRHWHSIAEETTNPMFEAFPSSMSDRMR